MKSAILAALVAAAFASNSYAEEECNRSPRTVIYNDTPVEIFVSDDTQRAEVIFPEEYLEGIYREVELGMNFYETPVRNKLAFHATDPLYTGLVYVDGKSSKTYILKVIARPGCADSQVTLANQPVADRSKMDRDSRGRVKGLMNHLFDGKVPTGYRSASFSHLSKEQKLVFRQGSVEFYVQSQVIGPKYTGTTYEIVNTGRTSTKIAIEQIDYSNRAVRESIGVAREVGMLPTSRILGPSPEYITEVYGDSHRGLMFIVSEKE